MNILSEWQRLISIGKDSTNFERIHLVNNFFNKIEYVEDLNHYGMEDYWATPVEFLSEGAGDCEDFSIAKYFTLREMGISDDNLRMCYCKLLTRNEYHMVLTYIDEEGDILVLDNIVDSVYSIRARPDLYPIYSFNSEALILEAPDGNDRLIADGAKRLSKWQELLKRYDLRRTTNQG